QLPHRGHDVELVPLLERPHLALGAEAEAHLADCAAAVPQDARGKLADHRSHHSGDRMARKMAGQFRAKKSLGQHFLTDPAVVRDTVEALEPRPRERILEIGPGRGVLTRALVEAGAEVVAVELDAELI